MLEDQLPRQMAAGGKAGDEELRLPFGRLPHFLRFPTRPQIGRIAAIGNDTGRDNNERPIATGLANVWQLPGKLCPDPSIVTTIGQVFSADHPLGSAKIILGTARSRL